MVWSILIQIESDSKSNVGNICENITKSPLEVISKVIARNTGTVIITLNISITLTYICSLLPHYLPAHYIKSDL